MVMSFLHSWADDATQPGPALAPPAARAPAAAHGGAQAPAPHVDPLFRIPRRAPAANIQAAAATTSAPAGISSIQGDSVATQLARLPLGTFSIEDRAVVEGFMNIRDQTTVADTLLTALLHDLGNAADSDPPIINTLSAIQSATQAAQASAKQGLAKVTKLAMYKTIPGFTPSTSAYMDKLEAMSKLVGTDDSVTLEDMKRVQALAASVNKLTSADPPPPFFKTSRFAPSPYIRHSTWDSVGAVGMVANGPVYAAGAAESYPAGAAGGYAAGAVGSCCGGRCRGRLRGRCRGRLRDRACWRRARLCPSPRLRPMPSLRCSRTSRLRMPTSGHGLQRCRTRCAARLSFPTTSALVLYPFLSLQIFTTLSL